MDTNQTPLQAFDAGQRSEAAEAGTPILRLSRPGCPTTYTQRDGATFLFMRGKKLLTVSAETAEHTAQLSDIQRAVDHDPAKTLVIADRGTLTATRRLIDRHVSTTEAGKQATETRDRIDMAVNLATSSRVVILPKVLATKWWIATGKDPQSIGDWRDAFGLERNPASLFRLFRLATQTDIGSAVRETCEDADISRHESKAMRLATRRTSTISMIDAFSAAQQLADHWTAAQQLDRIGKHRSVAQGTVVLIEACPDSEEEDSAAEQIRVSVSTPYRLRDGITTVMSEHSTIGDVQLTPASWDDEYGLVTHIRRISHTNTLARVTSLLKAGQPVYLGKQAFGFRQNRAAWKLRWASRPDPTPEPLNRPDLPLDVIVAAG